MGILGLHVVSVLFRKRKSVLRFCHHCDKISGLALKPEASGIQVAAVHVT
jgi:hypothetical protein